MMIDFMHQEDHPGTIPTEELEEVTEKDPMLQDRDQ